MCSAWIGMNVLMLDAERVVVEGGPPVTLPRSLA
jgi:hypothetical protein